MTLAEDLERIAKTAAGFASGGEELAGVLAAEPAQGGRVYLCAYRSGDEVSWLALDDSGEPVTDRERVREAASLVALSELAEESAGGGELDELRSRLVALRLTENPTGSRRRRGRAPPPADASARRRAWPRRDTSTTSEQTSV